ncbi:hypothetical protein BDF22DRAFT_675086 [Syncephalis plumigaleata]|nr:hypothetical protein BDF22DRAFT_675086 [Syncephalis plumigaleata]
MTTHDSSLIFDKELHALLGAKPPVKAVKVEQLTQLAVKYANNYKANVYSVERFIRKCPREYRLLDSRKLETTHKIDRQQIDYTKEYNQRFARSLDDMFRLVIDSGELAKTKNIWDKFNTFDKSTLDRIRNSHFIVEENDNDLPSSPHSSQPIESNTNVDSSAINNSSSNTAINDQQATNSATESNDQASMSLLSQSVEPTLNVSQLLQAALQQNPQLASLLQSQLSSASSPDASSMSMTSNMEVNGISGQVATSTIHSKDLRLNNTSNALSESSQLNNNHNNMASTSTSTSMSYPNSTKYIKPDTTIDDQKIKVLGRTLYIGGVQEQITEHDLNERFSVFGSVNCIKIDRSTKSAILTMHSHSMAKLARETLRTNAVLPDGTSIKVSGMEMCFGPKACFDFQQGYSIIALSELTSENHHYLQHAPIGGYEPTAPLTGGVSLEEPGEVASIDSSFMTASVNTTMYNNDNSNRIDSYTDQSTFNQQPYEYRQAQTYHTMPHSPYQKPYYRVSSRGRERDVKRGSWMRPSRSRSPPPPPSSSHHHQCMCC